MDAKWMASGGRRSVHMGKHINIHVGGLWRCKGTGGAGALAVLGINQVPGGLGGIQAVLPSGLWRPSIG